MSDPDEWETITNPLAREDQRRYNGDAAHDWQPYWDGSLGYRATDRCTQCGDYRPTTTEETTE